MLKTQTGKLATAATMLTTVSTAIAVSKEIKSKYDDKRVYTASIHNNSAVYAPLLAWLEENIVGNKSVRLITSMPPRVSTREYNGEGKSKVYVGGYLFKVQLSKPESMTGSSLVGKSNDEIVFTTTQVNALKALETLLVDLLKAHYAKEKSTFIYNCEGSYGWDGREFVGRDMDSVFLPQGHKEGLLSDLENFFGSQDLYKKIGAPWHRGYMFYGEPGNGKSSLVSAISSKFKMSIYNLPLASVKSDQELLSHITAVSKNSILLLEDIDIFSRSMNREQADEGPTLAGVLNALDGVSTPHGLLTIMTTNHPESLDPALTRPGRVDYRLELQAPDVYQIGEMFKYVYDQPLGAKVKSFGSMAEVMEIVKENMRDPQGARQALCYGNN